MGCASSKSVQPEPPKGFKHDEKLFKGAPAKTDEAAGGLASATAAALESCTATPRDYPGGLLSHQPDWLKEDTNDSSRKALAPVTLFSNSAFGGTAASTAATGNGAHSSSATVSSLPPIGRGLAAGSTGSSSSRSGGFLPALPSAADGMQLGGTTAGVQALPLPAPRRLTGSMCSNKARGGQSFKAGREDGASNGSSALQPAASSAAASHTARLAGADLVQDAAPDAPAADTMQQERSQKGLNCQASSSLSRSDSNSSAMSPMKQRSTAAAAAAAAASATSIDPSDPWSALQSHVAAAGPPSPDVSMPGSTSEAAAAVASGHMRSGVGVAGSLGAGVGAGSKRAATETSELVLEDSDEPEETEAAESNSFTDSHKNAVYQALREDKQNQAVAAAPAAAAAAPAGQRAGRLLAEGSAHSGVVHGGGLAAERSTVKAGGWGVGSMAVAGTLMLGDDEEGMTGSSKPLVSSNIMGVTGQDDVFGGDSPRPAESSYGSATVGHRSGVAAAAGIATQVASRSSSIAVGQQASAAVAGTQGEELGVEEIDDVDALIEAELAAKNALPGDLAAKLAAFEALAEDED